MTDKKVIVFTETDDIPITHMGKYAGFCWNSDITDHEKNYKRGLNCLESNHGRVMEFPQVYLGIYGYSARVIRELYTHIGGSPTRLQQSTRYCDDDFDIVVPPSINKNPTAKAFWQDAENTIKNSIEFMRDSCDIPKEDAAMLMPLGMETKIVFRTNLRHLIEMSHQRLCKRAYWEFRVLMKQIIENLAFYSDEWDELVNKYKVFVPKCEYLLYCPEKKGCGKHLSKEETKKLIESGSK